MKKITAIGIKKDNEPYRMQSKKTFVDDLNALPKGKYKHTVEKYYRKASPLQFGYLYSIVYPLSMIALNNEGYEFTEIDEIDIFWKGHFAKKRFVDKHTGEIMDLPLSKSQFKTIDEMSYCDAIRNYCSEYLSANIPEPDPNWKLNKAKLND